MRPVLFFSSSSSLLSSTILHCLLQCVLDDFGLPFLTVIRIQFVLHYFTQDTNALVYFSPSIFNMIIVFFLSFSLFYSQHQIFYLIWTLFAHRKKNCFDTKQMNSSETKS